MITTTDALKAAVEAAQAAGAVGVDTEFVWDRTYYPTLGVVQLGYPDGHCELIDATAIEDWAPLGELMADSKTTKILHDAQQDLTILRRTCGRDPLNTFDTQLSSGFIQVQSGNPRFHHSAQFVQHGGSRSPGLAHFFLLLKSFADHEIR